jgi:protein-arginine kinase activator protein McsA
MDKKTMNELADIIIAKLEIKQQQWDDEFHNSIADMYGKEGHKEAFVMTEEEMLIGELARLQTILMIFENNEEYEKAAIVLSKLNAVKTKLRKGDYNDSDED